MSSRCWPRAPRAPCFWAPHRHQGKPQGLRVQDRDKSSMSASAVALSHHAEQPARWDRLEEGRRSMVGGGFHSAQHLCIPEVSQILCCAAGSPG